LGGSWTTRRRTVTEADITAYAGLSGDFNPLYADVEHARSGPYGGLVSPAGLISSVTAGLGAMDVPVPHTVGLVGWTWRFILPVRPGDSIRSQWRLNRKRDVEDPRWGLATWQVTVENQRGETVAEAEVVRLVERREQPAEVSEGGRTGRRRRRRRGGGPAPEVQQETPGAPPPAEVVEAAPASPPDNGAAEGQQPAPRRRRRRGRTDKSPPAEAPTATVTADGGWVPPGGPAEAASQAAPAPSDAPAAPSDTTSPPGRPRRRRRAPSAAAQPELEPRPPEPPGP
jgi:3-hydroxybutyryl-CoA dehydratase